MTWALVIVSWVVAALALGLVLGAMIRRAEAKEHAPSAGSRPRVHSTGSSEALPGAPRPRRSAEPRTRWFHPIE